MEKAHRSIWRWLAPVLFLLVFSVAPLRAADQTNGYYLPKGKIDVVALLVAPPLAGSGEEAADLAEVRAVHGSHPASEEAIAWQEENGKWLFDFTPAIGSYWQPGKLPKTEAFFHRIIRDTAQPLNIGKNYWKRPRPFVIDPSLLQGKPEPGFSYPSGHSTVGTVCALVLAEIFPDKRDAILAIGRNIGWHRVMLAKHYPTDVVAGRVLAQTIVRELNANPDFQRDLAEVKAEIATRTPHP